MHTQYSRLLINFSLILLSGASVNLLTFEDVSPKLEIIAPNNLIYINDAYYYIEDRLQKNWFEARASCEVIGYNLVSFENIVKFNAIKRFLYDTTSGSIFWTSGNDFLTLGHHTWFPSGEPVSMELWAPNQPDNTGGVEHCDELRFKNINDHYKMNDQNCNRIRNYICERSP